MKLKSLFLVVCFSLISNVFAANVHMHPETSAEDQKSVTQSKKSDEKNLTYPGYCQIELINQSSTNVRVIATYDTGYVDDFNIYSYESPHYMNLYYHFYCHSGMYITIMNLFPPYNTIYSGWTNVNSTVVVRNFPYLDKKVQAEVTAR